MFTRTTAWNSKPSMCDLMAPKLDKGSLPNTSKVMGLDLKDEAGKRGRLTRLF